MNTTEVKANPEKKNLTIRIKGSGRLVRRETCASKTAASRRSYEILKANPDRYEVTIHG